MATATLADLIREFRLQILKKEKIKSQSKSLIKTSETAVAPPVSSSTQTPPNQTPKLNKP